MPPSVIAVPSPCRAGSVLILIAAFVVILGVLAFGFLSFVTEQRGSARQMQIQGLLRMALTSGRAHAMGELDGHVASGSATASMTALNQGWMLTFQADKITVPVYPTVATHPDPVARSGSRAALAGSATSSWAGVNAVDLFRQVPGLASPTLAGITHGFDAGSTVHDGTGRWFDVGYFERDLRTPAPFATASYRLRYAVAIIDLQGLIPFNKQKYEHIVDSTTTDVMDMGNPNIETTARAIVNRWYRNVPHAPPPTGAPASLPARDPQNPGLVRWNDTSDAASGFDNVTDGTDAVRMNSWRPIPGDHGFLVSSLVWAGFGIPDPTNGKMSDTDVPATPGGVNASFGKNTRDTFAYRLRVKGNLPQPLRDQGILSYDVKSTPFGYRFGDFRPFERSTVPPVGSAPYASAGANARRAFVMGSATGAIIAVWPDATSAQVFSLAATPLAGLSNLQADRYRQAMNREQIRNFHAGHVTTLLDIATKLWVSQPATRSWLSGVVWSGVDYINWDGIGQDLRTSRPLSRNDSTGLRVANKGDLITQCFTPFSTSAGVFSGVSSGGTPLTAREQKNLLEMGTQLPINVHTAPPGVLDALIRFVAPELPKPSDPSQWVSRDTDDSTGTTDYSDAVGIVREAIITWRQSSPATMDPVSSPDAWISKIPSPRVAFRTAMTSQFPVSSTTTSTARMGLSSLIYGGTSFRGPVAAFRVMSATWVPVGSSAITATGAEIVIRGHHFSRLMTPIFDTNPDVEHRLWFRSTSSTSSPAMDPLDPRLPLTAISGSNRDRDLATIPTATGAPFRPFRIAVRGSGATAPATVFNTTQGLYLVTVVKLNLEPSSLDCNPIIGGYGTRNDLKDLVAALAIAVPGPTPPAIAYIDFASERWRPKMGDPFKWLNFGPGLSLVSCKSRHYRIAVRARLENLDVPTDVRERSWDVVYRPDPDRSGPLPNTNGLWDGDVLYQDEENTYQRFVAPAGYPTAVQTW